MGTEIGTEAMVQKCLVTGPISGPDEGRKNFFHGRMDEDESLGTQRQSLDFVSMINLMTKPLPPLCGSLECFPCNLMKGPHSQHQQFHHLVF